MTESKVTILSLGAGVQSSAILIMSALGDLPKVDYAIFSDTGNEPKEVYEHLNMIEEKFAKPAGIPIIRVSAGDIIEDTLNRKYISMPIFSLKDGKKTMGRRQCTNEYKLRPIQEEIRKILGAPILPDRIGRTKKAMGYATVWIGISLDEVQRAKDSRVAYIKNDFPLLDKKLTRKDCITYLQSKGIDYTPKSSCIVCPFQKTIQWKHRKENFPEEFQMAVDFEKKLNETQQLHKPNVTNYLHYTYVPLDQVKFRKETEEEQLDLFTCSPFTCKADEEEFKETQKENLKKLGIDNVL